MSSAEPRMSIWESGGWADFGPTRTHSSLHWAHFLAEEEEGMYREHLAWI